MPTPSLSDLLVAPTAAQVRASILSTLQGLGFPVTDWETDGVAQQIVAAIAEVQATGIAAQHEIVAGGYLDLAAGLRLSDGSEAQGWLDLLAHYLYAVDRVPASVATGTLTVANSTAVPVVLAAGDVVGTNVDGYLYRNTAGGVVPALGSLPLAFAADQPGATGTAPAGTITISSGPAGISLTNPTALVGAASESNASLAARCRAKLASLSPAGAAAAYSYFASLAADGAGGLGVTRVGVAPAAGTGTVDVYGATATGPITGTASPPSVVTGTGTYELWKYLEANCVPDATSLVVHPATVAPIVVTVTVYVRSGGLTSAQVLVALADYLSTVPVGGTLLTSVGPRVVAKSGLLAAIQGLAGAQIAAVEMVAPPADVVVSATDVPVLDGTSAATVVVLP